MPEDLKPFRIVCEWPSLHVVAGGQTNDWDITVAVDSPNEGWEVLAGGFFLNRQTIDLHGLTAQEKTMFFSTQYLQRPIGYLTDLDFATTGGMTITDQFIVSDTPLDDIRGAFAGASTSFQAGYNSSPDDYITIKLAEGVVAAQNNAIPVMMAITDSWSFGSGDPTASNKLYLYRWVNIDTVNTPIAAGAIVQVPDVRYVGLGVTTKEKELVWMQRQKRAFEIQNQSLL